MWPCLGWDSGSSCQKTLRKSTAPLKRNEISEKSGVIQKSGLTPRQKPFIVFFLFLLKAFISSIHSCIGLLGIIYSTEFCMPFSSERSVKFVG